MANHSAQTSLFQSSIFTEHLLFHPPIAFSGAGRILLSGSSCGVVYYYCELGNKKVRFSQISLPRVFLVLHSSIQRDLWTRKNERKVDLRVAPFPRPCPVLDGGDRHPPSKCSSTQLSPLLYPSLPFSSFFTTYFHRSSSIIPFLFHLLPLLSSSPPLSSLPC